MKRFITFLAISFFLFGAFSCGALFFVLNHHWTDFSVLEHYNSDKPTILLDDEGNEWARFQLDRREPILLEDMPKHLINAFIAAEDWHFFSHYGVSLKGIIRSIFVNLYHGKHVQGASTITQQLVKLLFLTPQKSYSRKIKEQLCAVLIEQHYTKEQILQTYLNHIYFGCGIYGVQAAAQRFWDKDAAQLTLDESATLAAIICNPAQYCPLLCPLSSQRRRNIILSQMRKRHFITDSEFNAACALSLNVKQTREKCIAPHLKETLRLFLEKEFGKTAVYAGGLVVQTTVNHYAQVQAVKAFKQHCKTLHETIMPEIDGGMIVIKKDTGHIKALVGGYNFMDSKFNRVLQAKRQMGSVFKPILYAAAIEQGKCFADTFIDEPIDIILNKNDKTGWKPQNWNKKFNGQVTLAYALSRSNNIVSVKILLDIGVEKIIEMAKRFHLTEPFQPYPSLALGCTDQTIKKVVGMFNVFANNGVYVKPFAVAWVKDQWGTKIYKQHPHRERLLSTRVNSQVAKVLELGLNRIKKWFAHEWIDCQAISKTGTTNDSRTCWFAGSTPEYTTALYIGCDNNKSMGHNVYPVKTALPIWLAFNKNMPVKEKSFQYDPSLYEVLIDEKTGYLVSDKNQPGAISILV